MFSSKDHNWKTPLDLFNSLSSEFDFKLDACTSADNPLGCAEYYTSEENGLERDWFTWTFVNPPFKDVKHWVDKPVEEMAVGNGSVLLLPARTDTGWFHGNIWNTDFHKPQWNREVRFLKGRLRFGDQVNTAPFPSMIVIFRPPNL